MHTTDHLDPFVAPLAGSMQETLSAAEPLTLTRRHLLQAAGTASLLAASSLHAQAGNVLPLRTPGLDHLDIIVPDVEASARFYMQLFNTTLHAQPFQGAFRYFVLLGTLNDKREVAYLAIGDSRGRGTYIGHFCSSVYEWRRDSSEIFTAMGQQFSDAGFGTFPGSTGVGGIFADPDGIEIQFLPAPDTLVTAAIPSDLAPANQGLVVPHGIDHVLLHVSDLDLAVKYYNILYGPETTRDRQTGRVVFAFPASDTSLILEQTRYEYGDKPRIARFGIKVDAFDSSKVQDAVADMGGQVVQADNGSLRLQDPDGITLELVSVQGA